MASTAKFLRSTATYLCHIRRSSVARSRLSGSCCPAPSTSSACHSNYSTSGRLQNSSQSRDYTSGSEKQNFSTSQAIQHVEGESDSDALLKVNDAITSPDHGRLFAVVHFLGLQRKVTTDDMIVVRRHLEADMGETIRLNKVLLVGGKDFTLLGRPVLSPNVVKVEARIIEKTLEMSKIVFEYERRVNYRRFNMVRKPLTVLRIINIEVAPVIQ